MMKINRIRRISNIRVLGVVWICLLCSCNPFSQKEEKNKNNKVLAEKESPLVDKHSMESLYLTDEEVKALGIQVDSLPMRNIGSHFFVSGWLDISPKDRAVVTSFVGANVLSIRVREGDYVEKGAVLGTLTHPDLIRLQTDYYQAKRNLQLLKKEYDRQSRLYEGAVTSGRQLEQSESAYLIAKSAVLGQAEQLQLMGLNPTSIENGKIYNQISVRSPIAGFVDKVNVKIGVFTAPQTELFEIVNTDQIHADLMVFEEDVQKIRKGQRVKLSVRSQRDSIVEAQIFSIGKTFERDPKAVHVHARLENSDNSRLFPGMYVTGKIQVSTHSVPALPKEAIIAQDANTYVFAGRLAQTQDGKEWEFRPVRAQTGLANENWVQIELLEPLKKDEQVVWNQAYYLISEMNKGNVSHEH